MVYDVILIGGGVVGAAVARYLSRYRGSFLLLERNEDLCTGTSKANSGIVHAGFDCKPGTWKARCNVAGSRMMADLARELDFPYRRNGSLVLCFDPADLPRLEALKAQGERNGVEGLELLTGDQARALEPNLSTACAAALHAPAGAIVCPFGLTYALAENAADNGVAFRFDTPVTGLTRRGDRWQVETPRGSFETRAVVNAAGVYAAEIHNWVSGRKLCITPRRGQYLLLDREAGGHIDHTIFQLPGPLGKGVLVTPTVHGNLLLGPTAEEIDDFEGVDTTAAGAGDRGPAGGAERGAFAAAVGHHGLCGAPRPRDRRRFCARRARGRSGLLRLRGHRIAGPLQRPGHRAVDGGTAASTAESAGKPGFQPQPPGYSRSPDPALCRAAGADRGGPGLRADHLPL